MEYALLIYDDETAVPRMEPGEREELFAAYRAYSASLREAGCHRGSVKLGGTRSATSVRARNGRTLTTDGPFAETKEQLAGLYI
ncbi:MAG: YciI family protein, partial [Actinobacteria bacterium]|nr:YciI family protein [Actinomycetota bacterium]